MAAPVKGSFSFPMSQNACAGGHLIVGGLVPSADFCCELAFLLNIFSRTDRHIHLISGNIIFTSYLEMITSEPISKNSPTTLHQMPFLTQASNFEL